jgi:hypothetical protein
MPDYSMASTSSLITLSKLLRDVLAKCSIFLETQDSNSELYTVNELKRKNAEALLDSVNAELESRRGSLNFSIEDIYRLAGQKDAYVIFNFYPESASYARYGETVQGTVIYHRKERERLEDLVKTDMSSRSDGTIFLETRVADDDQRLKLTTEGFRASDIAEFFISNAGTNTKAYRQPGPKPIPNETVIKIDSRTFDVAGAQLYVLGNYKKQRYALPQHDLLLYFANLYLFKRDLISDDEINIYLLNAERTDFSDQADFVIHDIKVREKLASPEEQEHYKSLLLTRRDTRIEIIKQQLGISGKVLRTLLTDDFRKYVAIETSAWMFETETLSYLAPQAIIYWDYERFMHILLRHYPDFFIPSSTKGTGTEFQYVLRDLSTLVKIIITQLKSDIIQRISTGKEFRKTGIYFNGNHYQLQIAGDGRVMQFHPMD